jgi:hypothetical protein
MVRKLCRYLGCLFYAIGLTFIGVGAVATLVGEKLYNLAEGKKRWLPPFGNWGDQARWSQK